MPFCLMTHTASSLKRLSDGAESREHLLFRMVSHHQGSESPTAALDTYFDNNQRKCIWEYFFKQIEGLQMSNSDDSYTHRFVFKLSESKFNKIVIYFLDYLYAQKPS